MQKLELWCAVEDGYLIAASRTSYPLKQYINLLEGVEADFLLYHPQTKLVHQRALLQGSSDQYYDDGYTAMRAVEQDSPLPW